MYTFDFDESKKMHKNSLYILTIYKYKKKLIFIDLKQKL